MKTTLLIISTAAFFSILGLATAYVATSLISEDANDDFKVGVAVVPPMLGAVFGLILGVVAVLVGNKFPTRQKSRPPTLGESTGEGD